jgi:YD repeat-containing protein
MRFPLRLILLLFLLLCAFLPASVRAQEGNGGGAPEDSALTFQYFYDDRGQLIKVVDSTGNVVEYVYDEVGNMLEVNRFTITGLAIFNFTPQQGAVGTAVTVYGQGFDLNPAGNLIQFGGGMTAVVTAATATTLQVNVPLGAITGPVSATVGGETAVSTSDFTVTLAPVITSLSPNYALQGTTDVTVQVTGINLTGSTFEFLPLFNPLVIAVTNVDIDPAGQSANLTIDVTVSTLLDTFTLVATHPEGSSSPIPSPTNTFIALSPTGDYDLDGLTSSAEITQYGTHPLNPDTDGDGFSDGVEVGLGSNPLDPNSIPADPTLLPGESDTANFSLLNQANPAAQTLPGESDSPNFSILNQTNPADPTLPGESDSANTSILNQTNPADPTLPGESDSPNTSIQNQANPTDPNLPGESDGPNISVDNQPQ